MSAAKSIQTESKTATTSDQKSRGGLSIAAKNAPEKAAPEIDKEVSESKSLERADPISKTPETASIPAKGQSKSIPAKKSTSPATAASKSKAKPISKKNTSAPLVLTKPDAKEEAKEELAPKSKEGADKVGKTVAASDETAKTPTSKDQAEKEPEGAEKADKDSQDALVPGTDASKEEKVPSGGLDKGKEGKKGKKGAAKGGTKKAGGKPGAGGEKKKKKKKKKKNPMDNPAFATVVGSVKTTAKVQSKGESAKDLAANAELAAPVAKSEHMGNAQVSQVDEMEKEEPNVFDAKAFKDKLMKRIAGMQLPKDNEEAKNFDKHNNIDEINTQSAKDVGDAKDAAAGPIAAVSEKKPNVADTPARKPAELTVIAPVEKPKSAKAGKAIPRKRPSSEVNKPVQEEADKPDAAMAEANVTDEQLARSQEPKFLKGLDSKNDAKAKAIERPKTLRRQEKSVLNSNADKSEGASKEQLEGMNALRTDSIKKVTGDQKSAGTKDSGERERISGEINKIYNKAKVDVDKILANLDKETASKFKVASTKARAEFEYYVARTTGAYFKRRYGGFWGGAKWLKDQFMDVPSEINRYYREGRKVFTDSMDASITKIATFVATELTAAEKRIQDGKTEVKKYVDQLKPSQKKFGQEAAEDINEKFEQLSQDVNSKQDDLIDSLAESYMESLNAVDDRIEAMKEANKGLISKVMGFINGIIETIKKLAEMIRNLMSAIMSAIDYIMDDPIGFMSNLFSGIGKGFELFKSNIQNHLIGGLLTWLTGAMGPIGIKMPADIFSLAGVFDLVMQVLGLSWDYLRKKSVMMMGEPMVNALETGFEMFQTFRTKGVMGIWEHIQGQFQDLQETIIGAIKNLLITKVIEAGIKWLLGLLIPGAGFIKAIMAIKDIIVFFVESAIMLIPAITEGILALASGNLGGVAIAIEKGLASLISLVIGLFARLIGLGGLTKRVMKIFKKIRKRIDRAVMKLLKKARKAGRKLMRKVGIGKKGKKKKTDEKKDVDSGKGDIKWWNIKKKFKGDDGNKHNLYYKGKGNSAELMVASDPETVSAFLSRARKQIKDSKDQKIKKLSPKVKKAQKLYNKINKLDGKINSESKREKKEDLVADLKMKMAKLSQLLDPLTVVFNQDKYPPTILPPFTNGVKASGFTAEFLSKDQLDTGEISTVHNGDLPGWQRIKDEGFTTNSSRYVRMHLLSEALGGRATDSNLTPAPGPTVNIPFASGIERPAYEALKTDTYKRIWYKLTISYHSGEMSDYPKKISAKYGSYNKENGKHVKTNVSSYSKSIPPPFTDSVFKLNDLNKSGAQIGLKLGIGTKLGKYIFTVRNKYGTFSDSSSVIENLNTYKNSSAQIKLSAADIAVITMALASNKGKLSYKR